MPQKNSDEKYLGNLDKEKLKELCDNESVITYETVVRRLKIPYLGIKERYHQFVKIKKFCLVEYSAQDRKYHFGKYYGDKKKDHIDGLDHNVLKELYKTPDEWITYQEIVDALKIPWYRSGKPRIAQLKKLGEFCNIEQDVKKRKYQIKPPNKPRYGSSMVLKANKRFFQSPDVLKNLDLEALNELCLDSTIGWLYTDFREKLNIPNYVNNELARQGQMNKLREFCTVTEKTFKGTKYFYFDKFGKNQKNKLVEKGYSWNDSLKRGVYGIFSKIINFGYIGVTEGYFYETYEELIRCDKRKELPAMLSKLLNEPHSVVLLHEKTTESMPELIKIKEKEEIKYEKDMNYFIISYQTIEALKEVKEWEDLFMKYATRHRLSVEEAREQLRRFFEYK